MERGREEEGGKEERVDIDQLLNHSAKLHSTLEGCFDLRLISCRGSPGC